MNSPPKLLDEIKLSVPWGCVTGKRWGTETGERILLVHGTLDNAGAFDRLIALLPNNFLYVAIDLPGHGYSSHLPHGVSLEFLNYVLAIKIVLDELKWNNCVYIGHSFGAQLGVFTSILYPDRITKIICLDGFLPAPISNDMLLEKIRSAHEITLLVTKKNNPPLYTKEEIIYMIKSRRNFCLNTQAAEALFDRAVVKVGDRYKYRRDFRLRAFVVPFLDLGQYVELGKHIKCPIFIILAESSWQYKNCEVANIEELVHAVGGNFNCVRVGGNHDVHNNNPEKVAPHIHDYLCGTIKSKL